MRTISTLAMLVAAAALPACMFANQPNSAQKKQDEVVFAQKKKEAKDRLQPRIYLSADRLQAGDTLRFAVVIDIEDGWHINTNLKRPAFVVPTKVEVAGKHETKITDIAFPRGKTLRMPGLDEPLTVYESQVILFGDLTVPENIAGRTEELEFTLKYQLCNEAQCLAPKTVKLKGKVPVVQENAPVRVVNSELFKRDPRQQQTSERRRS